ncbi:unnamed protein product [Alopecurus aequalis]
MPEAPASPAKIEWTLPADLLLEIVARSDTRTLFRCAATSKLLRRDILDPPFIHRATRGGILPGCILACLNTHDNEADPPPPLSLVPPTTTAAAVSFLDDILFPYTSRFANDLLGEYIPVMSRGGLVLLRRRRNVSDKLSNLCVYNLITGHRTFLSNPPDIVSNSTRRYVLLTAADGIGCSFMVFSANRHIMLDNNIHIIQVQTATSVCPTWAKSAMVHKTGELFEDLWYAMHRGAAVLYGGVIHWLVRRRGEIVTYNVCTMEQGTIMLPAHVTNFKGGRSHLGSYYSHDGRKLLRLMVFKEFKIYVWHQLPDGEWAPANVLIDMEKKLQLLDPHANHDWLPHTNFKWSGEGSNMVLLLYGSITIHPALLILIDLETKEILMEYSSISSVLLEVDLPSRLRSINFFA